MQAIELTGTFSLSPEKMWDKWTLPELMMVWFKPGGMHVSQAMRDLRELGQYRFRFNAPDGSEQTLHGNFSQIKEKEMLAFSWQWQDEDHSTQVTVEFTATKTNSCDIKLTHKGFWDQEDRDLHEQAWLFCLENLSLSAT